MNERHTRLLTSLSLLALIVIAGPGRAHAANIRLPREVPQGGLVIGHVLPSCHVSYAGQELRIGKDGRFAFGVGRDTTGPLTVDTRCPGQPPQTRHIAVRERTWPTERVNGVPPKTVSPPPAIAERIARERKLVAEARTRNDAREDFEHGFIWPVHGRISGRFGSQRIYNGKPRAPHSGVDIAVPRGTPVKAPAAGVVTLAKRLYLSGNTVIIDHGFGISSVMLHMEKLKVKPGQHVRQGQVVGLSGMTGRATGPHVHWGMNWFGVRMDPRTVAREHPASGS
ncbi:M23 family metallopeptidase [Oleiagrimonas sp. MCCC 1A03011]|uniref:M23 family metallopeptidase n=1 Tax=Oleiagrimonas sp. MCCC 1A03011 TaxID=1926883 RepID=UPI000DC2F979|nr:M23 family metallopeptidase [Oleiagrimonas sp. MCCC 1A03011]RAP56389.1 peptidase M23 [Oleiagrimonas sp. MCCC 1A03011]